MVEVEAEIFNGFPHGFFSVMKADGSKGCKWIMRQTLPTGAH